MSAIVPTLRTVSELLRSRKFAIDDYQREYKWENKQIVELLFAGHSERGTTLILVTHDASLAARCDRVMRLRSGHIDSDSVAVPR